MTQMNGPVLPNIGVLALVPDTWGMIWQTRHHVLSRLARYFRVVWLEPGGPLPHGRMPPARDVLAFPGLEILHAEHWLALLSRPEWLARYSFLYRIKRARSLLLSHGCEKIILYLWRPEFAPALQTIRFDLSCYHIDDEYTFSATDMPIPDAEARLLRSVDRVFIHSPALFEKKGRLNPYTTYVPNGVDYAVFSRLLDEPPDLAPVPHPRIGYAGFLKRQLDWPLLLYLAGHHRDWSFVFVGPQSSQADIQPYIRELSLMGNVHFLGAKSTSDIAAYPQHFDVCIMPYRTDGYTKYIYPLKLHEYLACGRPTVGNRIPSLVTFSEVVTLAGAPEEWSAAVSAGLQPTANRETDRAARQAVAQRHDWHPLILHIARSMVQGLGREYVERLDGSPNIANSRQQCASEPRFAPCHTFQEPRSQPFPQTS